MKLFEPNPAAQGRAYEGKILWPQAKLSVLVHRLLLSFPITK